MPEVRKEDQQSQSEKQDREKLVRQVAEKVWKLWQADLRQAQERRGQVRRS